MNEDTIEEIIRLRWAVYRLGAAEGAWNELTEEAVKGFMEFLFPKSKYLAHYTLMLNVVLNSESMKQLPAGSYNLFKFPEQIEEKILDYQKKHVDVDFSEKDSIPMNYLDQMATIVSDADMFSSSVGSLDDVKVENMNRILAYRYRTAFTSHQTNYPYFE